MECFNDYWKKKSAKLKTSWEKKSEQYAAKHYQLDNIREIVFTPIDYDRRGYDADAFINSYFKVTNPIAQWDQGNFHFSESALQKAMEEERADMNDFTMKVDKVSIKGLQAPAPDITDYGKYNLKTSFPNRVWDFKKKYHAWLKQIYNVCTDMEIVTLNYRQVTMTIKRYTIPDLPFAYYEINPCVQLMKSPLLMEETGFSVLNVAFLLMEMAAEWELRQEELNYYAKHLKVRKMDAVTTDGIDLESWNEKTLKQKLLEIKQFMDAITERDFANHDLLIPLGKAIISMKELLNRKLYNVGLRSYLDQVGLQEVKAYVSDNYYDRIIMEYQERRMILKYKDSKMYFYPYANLEEDWDSWTLNKKRCVEFKGLTLSAIAEYLKLVPKLWQSDKACSSDIQDASV